MRYAAAAVVCVAVLGLAGCATNKSGSASSGASMGIVNSKCPMAGTNPAGNKITRDFKGDKVGF